MDTARQTWSEFWDPIGETFCVPIDEKDKSPFRPKYVNIKPGKSPSAFFTVESNNDGTFKVAATVHHETLGKIALERTMPAAEYGMLADIPHRDLSPNESARAAEFGADIIIKDLFVRKGKQFMFPVPGSAQTEKGAVFCGTVIDAFTIHAIRLIRHGRVDRPSATEKIA